jgi:hypothetical protein
VFGRRSILSAGFVALVRCEQVSSLSSVSRVYFSCSITATRSMSCNITMETPDKNTLHERPHISVDEL